MPNKPPITCLRSANSPRCSYTFHKQFFFLEWQKTVRCPYFLLFSLSIFFIYCNGAGSYQSVVCPVVQLSVAVGMFQYMNGLHLKFKPRIEWTLLAWTTFPFQRKVGYSNINIVLFDRGWTEGTGIFSRTSPISKLLLINTNILSDQENSRKTFIYSIAFSFLLYFFLFSFVDFCFGSMTYTHKLHVSENARLVF